MAEILQGPPPTEKETLTEGSASAPENVQASGPEPLVIDVNNVTAPQRLAILRSVFSFFSEYDRVPGGLAKQWGNALEALVVVINAETKDLQKAADEASKK